MCMVQTVKPSKDSASFLFSSAVSAFVIGAGVKYAIYHSIPAETLTRDIHGVAAYLAVLGAIYSIIMAFVLFVVWEQFNDVQKGIAHEAAALEDICRIGGFFSDRNIFTRIREEVRQYLNVTTTEERRCLSNSRLCATAEERFAAICKSVRDIELQTDKDRLFYDQLLNALERSSDARDERLSVSATRVPHTLWQLILFVSCALFAGFLFLGIGHFWLSVGVAGAVAACLVFLLEVIHDMDNPFDGMWNVSYTQMTAILGRIGRL